MSTAATIDPSDKPLPLSKKALQAVADARTWDASVHDLRARSESRAWAVAGGSVALALLGFGMALFQATRPIAAPVPIVVDRTTGETMVVSSFDADSVPRISALDQHNAAVFVRAYESYYFNLLKRDYDQVARMSTQEVFGPYSGKFTGEGAMQTKLGTSQEHRVTVISVRMSSTTRPGQGGEAIVTFDKQLKSQNASPALTRYVSTVRFEYRPAAMKRDVDRIENPFGFVVLSYRADPELLAPGAMPAPAAGAEAAGSGT